MLTLMPAVCLAWLGLPAHIARAASAPAQGPGVASVLDRVATHRGNHDALYSELMEYYLESNHPQRTLGVDAARAHPTRRTRAAKIEKAAVFQEKKSVEATKVEVKQTGDEKKVPVAKDAAKPAVSKATVYKPAKEAAKPVVDQKHLQSDKNVVKVEVRSAVAIGVVCVLVLLYWRFRANPLANEAWGGIDKDFIPIREADTGETEEQKEFARKEAAKAIARAKRKEKEFAERQRTGGEVAAVEVQQMRSNQAVEPETELSSRIKANTIDDDDVQEDAGQDEVVTTVATTAPTKKSSPGLVALAMLSVMADDIKKELNNMPKSYIALPASRVMTCKTVKGNGKSMVVRTPRVKVHGGPGESAGGRPSTSVLNDSNGSHESQTSSSDLGYLDGKDLLLAPVAVALKEISGKRVAPLLADKYNPMFDLHNYVRDSADDGNVPRRPRSDRDPFVALLTALQTWEGPKAPESLKKYDPASNLDRIAPDASDASGDAHPDPLISLIKAAKAFEGPKASERLTKYDPLGQLEKIPVSTAEDGKEYSLLQAMLRAAPERGEGPDHSIIKALVNAKVDISPARYDVWKAAMDVKFPEVDLETFFPVIGDIMTRLRENAAMSTPTAASMASSMSSMISNTSTMEDEVAEAERKADEAERKALALLERIERKEDELLNKVQQLKASLTDTE